MLEPQDFTQQSPLPLLRYALCPASQVERMDHFHLSQRRHVLDFHFLPLLVSFASPVLMLYSPCGLHSSRYCLGPESNRRGMISFLNVPDSRSQQCRCIQSRSSRSMLSLPYLRSVHSKCGCYPRYVCSSVNSRVL